MRARIVMILLVAPLSLVGLAINHGRAGAQTPERRAGGTGAGTGAGTEWDGVWESLAPPRDKPRPFQERLDAMNKCFLLNKGARSYWITASTGVTIDRYRLHYPPHPASRAVDLVNVDDLGERRCLYEARADRFHLYGNAAGRPLQRPPGKDVRGLQSFKRVPGARVSTLGVKEGRPLAGLWETVGFEKDGVRYEDEDDPTHFWKSKRVFYFDEGWFIMFSTGDQPLTMGLDYYSLVPAQGKNAIDFKNGDHTIRAIYSLQGLNLDLSWNPANDGPRPNRLGTVAGTGFTRLLLRRVDLEE